MRSSDIGNDRTRTYFGKILLFGDKHRNSHIYLVCPASAYYIIYRGFLIGVSMQATSAAIRITEIVLTKFCWPQKKIHPHRLITNDGYGSNNGG